MSTTGDWNPTTGCDQVSPGCDQLLAGVLVERVLDGTRPAAALRRLGLGRPGCGHCWWRLGCPR